MNYWNKTAGKYQIENQTVSIGDETLRDGLQSPSVCHPTVEEKKEILDCMDRLGVQAVDLGLPAAGENHQNEVQELAEYVLEEDLSLRPYCAVRTLKRDITPVVEISDRVGHAIEPTCYIGSSPIRQLVEEWDLDHLKELTERSMDECRRKGLTPTYVTEDTTRAKPEHISALYGTAIEHGAGRIVVCDTVGHALPGGVTSLIMFVREIIVDSGEEVDLVFHGHRDRGMSVPNTMAAIEAGVDEIHVCALGIGERAGNTPTEQMMLLLNDLGVRKINVKHLSDYTDTVAEAVDRTVPDEILQIL